MKNNPVPADRSTWATYSKLTNRNEEELHGILEEAAKDKSAPAWLELAEDRRLLRELHGRKRD